MNKILWYGLGAGAVLGAGYLLYEYLTSNNSSTQAQLSGLTTQGSNAVKSLGTAIKKVIPNSSTSVIPKSNIATNGASLNIQAVNPTSAVSITPYGSNTPIVITPQGTTSNGNQIVNVSGVSGLGTVYMPKSSAGYSGNTTAGLGNALSEEQTAYNLLGQANVSKYGYKTTTNSSGQAVYSLG